MKSWSCHAHAFSPILWRGLSPISEGGGDLAARSTQQERSPSLGCGIKPQGWSGNAMSKIRVLLIADSVVARRFLSELVASEADMEVAGVAPNGRIALSKIPQTNPDLVVLDLEMPEMDGVETLADIRRKWPRMPVIMFSALTLRGARATLDAMEQGAIDYVTKPKQMGSREESACSVRADLIPKIRALVTQGPSRRVSPENHRPPS